MFQSQGRRPHYEKYMSKPSLFRSQSGSYPNQGKPSQPLGNKQPDSKTSNYQQQLSMQKARAKERDEK